MKVSKKYHIIALAALVSIVLVGCSSVKSTQGPSVNDLVAPIFNSDSPAEEPALASAEETSAPKAEEPSSPKAEEPSSSQAEKPLSAQVEETASIQAKEPSVPKAEEPSLAQAKEPSSPPVEEPSKAQAEKPSPAPSTRPARYWTPPLISVPTVRTDVKKPSVQSVQGQFLGASDIHGAQSTRQWKLSELFTRSPEKPKAASQNSPFSMKYIRTRILNTGDMTFRPTVSDTVSQVIATTETADENSDKEASTK